MNLKQVEFLIQPHIQQLLSSLHITEQNHLQTATKLGKDWTSEQIHALIETAILRQRANKKFSKADQMLFTRSALEQSSGEEVSTYRAEKFKSAGIDQIVDLCCSIGGDAISLAEHMQVTGIDIDPTRLMMAEHNLTVYGKKDRFRGVQADLLTMEPYECVNGFFFDPARRTAEGKRIFRLRNYQPTVEIIDRWLIKTPSGGIKISPGIDYTELPPSDVATVEFISVRGEVREAVLWYGELRGSAGRSATLLPSKHQLFHQPTLPKPMVTRPKAWLYEPDGAVIRAHLVKELAAEIDGSQIDSSIALLTTDSYQATPFARAFEVVDHFPFQLKKLRRFVRENNIGRITVKKRGSPIDPQWLEKQLKPKGKKSAVLFLTQAAGKPIVIVCQPV